MGSIIRMNVAQSATLHGQERGNFLLVATKGQKYAIEDPREKAMALLCLIQYYMGKGISEHFKQVYEEFQSGKLNGDQLWMALEKFEELTEGDVS